MRLLYLLKISIWTKLSKPIFVQGWIPRTLLEPRRALYIPRGGWHNEDNIDTDDRIHDDPETESSKITIQEDLHQSNESISSENSNSIDHNLSHDEKIDDEHSDRVLDKVQIIPFDEEVGEECGDNSDSSNELPDDMRHEIRAESLSNDTEHNFNSEISTDEVENSFGSTLSRTSSRPSRMMQFESTSSLRERIINLIWKMEQDDIHRFGDTIKDENSVCKQMYQRAHEYVEELEIFEQNCRRSLSENKDLPSLEKTAPHPKSFLHYIAPKIHAIKQSPEVMLKIRNAEIDDVRNAVNAIALMGCLVDLYITVLRRLHPCGTYHYIDSEAVKSVIREDRRLQQLMECALCGININRWLQNYKAVTEQRNVSTNADHTIDQRTHELSNLGEEFDEIPTEFSDLSFCNRWMMGLLSLVNNNDVTVNSCSGKEIAVALAMKSYDILRSEEFIKRIIDEQTRTSAMDEIIDVIRVISYSKDTFQIYFDFILCFCIDLLWKDIKAIKSYSADIYSEVQEDEIIDRLSEDNSIEDENCTSFDKSVTAIDNPLTERKEDHLINYLPAKRCIKLLKALLRSPCQQILSSPIMTALVDIVTVDLQNEVNNFFETRKRQTYGRHVSSPIDGIVTIIHLPRDNVGTFLDSSQPVLRYGTNVIIDRLENIIRFATQNALGILLNREPRTKADEVQSSGFCHLPSHDFGLDIRNEHDAQNNCLYECSVIMHAVSTLGKRSGESIMESCLSISEDLSVSSIGEIEDADILNLLCGFSSIASKARLAKPSANRLVTLLKTAMEKNYKHLRLREITRLLESIATILSTQSCQIIHEIADEKSFHNLIEHGISLIRGSASAPITDMIILAWVHSEWNKNHTISSWENFELLGQCSAEVSSSLFCDRISNNDDDDHCNPNRIGCDGLCKLAFALSLNDLKVNSFCHHVLINVRQDWEQFDRIHILDKIRFLFSLAKTSEDERPLESEFAKDIERIATVVMKADFECVSPYYYALAIWSMGRLRGEGLSSLWENIPSYTREDIKLLSPEMALRMLHGIVSIITEKELHSNLKAQLLIIHLLSQIDNQMELMSPKELCSGGRSLLKLREYCVGDELDLNVSANEQFHVDDSHGEFNDDGYEWKNEAEELVIGSLYPGSNIREIFQLSDKIIIRLLNHVSTTISSFSAKEMKVILNISRHMQHKKSMIAAKHEIDSRVELVRKCLSPHDHGSIDEVHQHESQGKESSGTYTSKIKRLFSSASHLETAENESESSNKDEFNQNINLLRSTLNDIASNDFLLKTSLDAAYDLGTCIRQIKGRSYSRRHADPPPLSYLYL